MDAKLLERLLVVTVRGLEGCTLTELCCSLTRGFPGLAAHTIHDGLNDLLASGRLVLTNDGVYKVP